MKRLNRAFLYASLALWRRRAKYRQGRVNFWIERLNHANKLINLRKLQLKDSSGKGSFGIDWAYGNPNTAALKKAQVEFACRYLSHDLAKNLTPGQAKALARAGIDIVVVWETTAKRPLNGRPAGVADAEEALKQAKSCGLPPGAPIYFAVDFDETPGQVAAVASYFRGVHDVLDNAGPADMPRKVPVGAYGGYWPIKRLFDDKLIDYGWQTYAWSRGAWDGRAQLQQYKNGQKLAGLNCDFDRATADDFGQWRPQ